jgi:splicing factor U2AF subunit
MSNLPPPVTEEGLTAFFNLQMNSLNVIRGHDPCIASKFARDGSYAVVEFKLPEDATVALAFDGITMEEHATMDNLNGTTNGTHAGLTIRRPKDYIAPHVTEDIDMEFTDVSREVRDSQNKLMISSLPDVLSDIQVQELLAAFGVLKSFVLVKDRDTEQSRVSSDSPDSFRDWLTLAGNRLLRIRRS